VAHIETDDENAKITVDIGNHDTIVSVLPQSVVDHLELEIGSMVAVQIKANDVMIGK